MKAAIVSTLGEWGGGTDPLEKSWIAHGAAMLATLGGDLFETRHTTLAALVEELRTYDLIGVSATSATYPVAREVLEAIRGFRARRVVGGVHASLRPEDYAGLADHVVQGHGEPAWSLLLEGCDLPAVSWYDVEDLDRLPFIERRRWRDETQWLDLPGPYATFVAARGCPYRCTFCWPAEEIHFGKRLRRRSAENLVAELARVKRDLGIQAAQIHDDTFTYDRKWVDRFIELAAPLGLQFFIGTRADHVCEWPEMYARLREVGVRVVSVGFESGNQRMLDLMRKGTTVAQNIEAGDILHGLGLRVFANYMFGLPGETPAEMLDTVNMIRRIRPEYHSTSIFSPYPGSYLGEEVRKQGQLQSAVWRRDPSRAYLKEQDLHTIQTMMAMGRM